MNSSTSAEVVAVIDGVRDDAVQDIRRSAGVGGSEISAVLGLSPWTSELELWERKRGERGPQEPNVSMEWGLRLEPIIVGRRAEDAAVQGRTVIRPKRIYRSVTHRDCIYSPDAFEVPLGEAFDIDHPAASHLVVDDAKTQSPYDTAEWDVTHPDSVMGIPVHYWLQLQQGALVFGADELAVDVLFGGRDYRRFVCEPDYEVGEMLAVAAANFMEAVREGRQPKPDPKHPNTGPTLARLYRGKPGVQHTLSFSAAKMLLDLAALREERDWAQTRIDEIYNEVRAEMGEATEGVCPYTGRVLATWSPAKEVPVSERPVSVSDVREAYPNLMRGLARRIGRDPGRSTRINVRSKAVTYLRDTGKATTMDGSE